MRKSKKSAENRNFQYKKNSKINFSKTKNNDTFIFCPLISDIMTFKTDKKKSKKCMSLLGKKIFFRNFQIF